MTRKPARLRVSPELRRLVNRALYLHTRAKTVYYYPSSKTTLAQANLLNHRLKSSARDAKARLLAALDELENNRGL